MWNSLAALTAISSWTLWIGAGAAALSVVVSLVSTITANRANAIASIQANERISVADARGAEANAKAQEAIADAAKANASIEEQKARAAEFEKQAAETRLEAERLKQAIAWREISPDAFARLVTSASRNPGSLNLRYVDNDPESLFLAIQIAEAFKRAGWQVGMGAVKLPGLAFGLIVDASSETTGQLEQTLRDCQVGFVKEPIPPAVGFNMTTVTGPTLLVGSKPR